MQEARNAQRRLAGRIGSLVAVAAAAALAAGCASPGWRGRLAAELPVLGHRNWICVVDSAYPAQTAAGIETLATGGRQVDVVKAVLGAVDEAAHVRAVVYLDAELPHVAEADARGIGAYRKELREALGNRLVTSLPHEKIIARLDDAAKVFRVLILKTDLTLPYTSVFINLDCAYWSGDAQKRLLDALPKAK